MQRCLDELIRRLDSVDQTNYTIEFGIHKLHIIGETHTIGRLIARYVFDLMPTIEFVNMRTIHPSMRECVVDIKHPEAITLIKDAINAAKKDIETIYKQFNYSKRKGGKIHTKCIASSFKNTSSKN
jgi:DNA-directed RNA polymerase subunit L